MSSPKKSLVSNSTSDNDSIKSEPDWWCEFAREDYSTEKCLQLFKCSRRTYMSLIKTLKPHISPKLGTSGKKSWNYFYHKSRTLVYFKIYISDIIFIGQIVEHIFVPGVHVEKQVAIFLFKITTAADYTVISKKFKIHKTTIHKIVYKCVVGVNRFLLHKTISMPKDGEAEIIASDFEQVYKIPQLIGAMAIVHIPVTSPINLNYQFLNSKLYPSFVMQVVVDSNFR